MIVNDDRWLPLIWRQEQSWLKRWVQRECLVNDSVIEGMSRRNAIDNTEVQLFLIWKVMCRQNWNVTENCLYVSVVTFCSPTFKVPAENPFWYTLGSSIKIQVCLCVSLFPQDKVLKLIKMTFMSNFLETFVIVMRKWRRSYIMVRWFWLICCYIIIDILFSVLRHDECCEESLKSDKIGQPTD